MHMKLQEDLSWLYSKMVRSLHDSWRSLNLRMQAEQQARVS